MLTVIVPCFNGKKTINRAIDSVLPAPGVNILVVDDGCPDETGKYVELAYSGEERVKVITHSKNLGLGEARNTGIDTVDSKFVTFLDADDYWQNGPLALRSCEALDQAEADVGFMPVVMDVKEGHPPEVYPDGHLIAPFSGRIVNIHEVPQMSVIQPCWSQVYRHRFLIQNNIRFHRRKFEDHDFGLEVVLTADRLLVLSRSPTIHYDKTRQGTLSSSILTPADHKLYMSHVARVLELLLHHPEIHQQFRAERACHYTFRLLYHLLKAEHLTEELVVNCRHLIESLCMGDTISELLEVSCIRSDPTERMLKRHSYLPNALDHAVGSQSRFTHFIQLLRFIRQQPIGKARTLGKLGLRVVSMPWR
ncbi:MAG: glycosyltransferase [Alphaproteobacteria bacterium]|nr:glycosyltransferase [Alphaproteobacteria bacterium]